MREIRFVAFDKKNNKLLESEYLHYCGGAWYESFRDLEDGIQLNLNDVVILQYTGLKDKNGAEIYEGDIVKVSNHPFEKEDNSLIGMKINGNYPVYWSESEMTYIAGSLLLARLKPYVEVIGNVFKNYELLQKKTDSPGSKNQS